MLFRSVSQSRYGGRGKEWDKKEYNVTLNKIRSYERTKKEFEKSVKHFLITELGHNGTERIHLHGILFTNEKTETIQEIWKYGIIWIGQYTNEKTINYIMKYITKVDEDQKGFKAVILTSAGIGKQYTENKHKTIKNKQALIQQATTELQTLTEYMTAISKTNLNKTITDKITKVTTTNKRIKKARG